MKKYTEWSEYRKTLLTPEELEIIDAKVKLICEIIDAREKQGITQQELSEASVRDILALIKSMYDSGALDSGDNFSQHFITVPSKFNILCPQCNREGYAVEGLDFRCEFCGCIAKWDESQRRYFPNLGHL